MPNAAGGPPGPRSLLQLNIAAAGMAAVAFVCAASGLGYGAGKILYGSGTPPSLKDALYVIAFLLLTAPYYFYREAFVEEPHLTDREKSNNTFFAFVIALTFAVIVILSLTVDGIHLPEAVHLIFLMGIVLIPFAYLGVRSFLELKKGGDAAQTERLFKNKVLLPAFATCLVSFAFGWSITDPDSAYVCVALPVILIVLLKEMGIRIPRFQVSMMVVILCLFLIFCIVLYRAGDYPFAKPLIIGMILTFAMGVAEVCKRVVRFRRSISRGITDQYSVEPLEFYDAGSNWSSIVFPLLVCFLPLLIDDLPVWPIFALLSIQYLHWNHWTRERESGFLLFLNVLLGLLLPIFVCFQYIFPVKPVGFGIELFDRLTGFTAFTVALVLGVAAFFGRDVGRFLRSAMVLRLEAYSDYENCFFLFLFVMLCTFAGVYIYGILAPPFFTQPLIGSKAAETTLYLLLLLVFSIGMYWYNNLDRMRVHFAESDGATEGDPLEMTALKFFAIAFTLLLYVGRLPVATIAALPVSLLIAFHTDAPVLLAFIHAIPICCVTMAGFALNDLFDLDKDRAAGRDKPLALNLVTVRQVRVFAWCLTAIGFFTATYVSQNYSIDIIIAALGGVAAYSWVARKLPILKGIATGVLCCAPFAYAAVVCSIPVPSVYYGFLIVFISGRELLLDVKDFEGDLAAGVRTLVAYLRPRSSCIIGWLLMIASLAIMAAIDNGIGRILFVCTLCSLSLCLLIYLGDERKGLAYSRITLLLGVISVGFSL